MVSLAAASNKWGYIRIISGTILGGVFGFYVMHHLELSYKEKMNERLRQYEKEKKLKEESAVFEPAAAAAAEELKDPSL